MIIQLIVFQYFIKTIFYKLTTYQDNSSSLKITFQCMRLIVSVIQSTSSSLIKTVFRSHFGQNYYE